MDKDGNYFFNVSCHFANSTGFLPAKITGMPERRSDLDISLPKFP